MNKQILTKELEVISKCIENGITTDNKELIRRGVFGLRIITDVLAAEEPSAEKKLPAQKSTDQLYSHSNDEKNPIDSLADFINSSTGEFNAENITEVRACMQFDQSAETELPCLVYSIQGYTEEELEFEIIISAEQDGCIASDIAFMRRKNLLNITVSIARYITRYLLLKNSFKKDIANTASYLLEMVGSYELPKGWIDISSRWSDAEVLIERLP